MSWDERSRESWQAISEEWDRNELRQPLPPYLKQVQRQAMSDYLANEDGL